jgi:hypothetical protein
MLQGKEEGMDKVIFCSCSRFLSKRKVLYVLLFGLMIVSGLIPAESRGAFYYYEALIDVDNNPLTGGSVTVVQKDETPHSVNGIDYIVRVTFDDSINKLGPIHIEKYNSGTAGFDLVDTNSISYDMGRGNGYQGYDVVEFLAARSLLGNPTGTIRVTYHASIVGANDYTASFSYNAGQGLSSLTIPTLSQWGMLIFIVALGFSAIGILISRKLSRSCVFSILLGVLGVVGIAWAATIILDGQVGDWININPSVIDPFCDSSNDDLYEDIIAGFITSDQNNLYFRMDIAGGAAGLQIGWANLQWPPTINHTISAINRTPTVYGQVWIDGVTNQPGATNGLRAQLGFGPSGSIPENNPLWTWVEASFSGDAGNNDEFMASLLPDVIGTFDYVYRYTTTNGCGWFYADLAGPIDSGALPSNPGKLTVNPSPDVTAPSVPTGLHVVSSSPTSVQLAWDAIVGDPTLYGYEILQSQTAGGPYALQALVAGFTNYNDTNVVENATYYYVVRAVDMSFNRSANSAEVSAVAMLRTVSVVFNVAVPATTDGTGRSVYIAGSLDRLDGGLPQWNPSGVVLTRVDATHWTITLTGKESTQIEYKYTLGDWNHVEKDGTCGEISNRQLTLSYGLTGTMTINDVVLNWRNVAPCGN